MVHLNSLRINMKKNLIFERLKCFRGPYTALLCHWTCRLNGAAGSANMNHAATTADCMVCATVNKETMGESGTKCHNYS